MPSSLIIVALVVAWLVVLVPMVVRKRQEIARTADSELAARVVRSGSAEDVRDEDSGEAGAEDTEAAMGEADDIRDDFEDQIDEESEDETDRVHDTELVHEPRARADVNYDGGYADEEFAEPYRSVRPYRPGRGGFDPEAAAVLARAKYAFRQRVVLAMLIGALVSGVLAGVVFPALWWAHGTIDVLLIGYLGYLRRQVRIEQEIRERRLARMRATRHAPARPRQAPAPMPSPAAFEDEEDEYQPDLDTVRREPVSEVASTAPPQVRHPTAVVVDVDDEDPAFAELAEPGELPYRRAVGE